MPDTTYYAARPFTIETVCFETGDVVGTGDVNEGKFVPDKKCPPLTECGHIIPRLADGRITTDKPAPPAPDKKPAGKKPDNPAK